MYYIYLVLYIFFENGYEASAYPDGGCYTRPNGQRGVCKPLQDCVAVRADFQQGIFPTPCGFYGWSPNPIICCPLKLRRAKPHLTKPTPLPASKETKSYGETSRKKCSEISNVKCANFPSIPSNEGSVYNQLLVQGVRTFESEFPHMAAIGYGEVNNILWQCGGSLISENFVITAAHCLFSRGIGPAKWVHLGAERLQDDTRGNDGEEDMIGQTHPVIQRFRHPDYRPPSKYNDIALLKLGPSLGNASSPIVGESIYPACLHTEEKIPNSRGIATGWGKTGIGEELSPDLLKVDLSITDLSICNESYKFEISSTPWLTRGIDSSLMCAGDLDGGEDTCLGDSGGPLQYVPVGSCVHRIIAVTSFGKVCGLANAPGVYTRISYFVPWIESIIWPE